MEKCVDTQTLTPKHRLFSKNRVLFLAMVMALLGAGCTEKVSGSHQSLVKKTSASSKYHISTLKIGVLPTQSRTEQERMVKSLKEYLEESFRREVDTESQANTLEGQGRRERQGTQGTQKIQAVSPISFDFQIAKDYKEIIDLLVQDKLDMAYLGPLGYVEAVERGAKFKPLVTAIDKYTRQPWYRACILVKENSPIKTLKDLKGKRIAFVDKSSTSGYLMPVVAFNQLGIDSQRDFAQVIYAGSHSKSMAALEDGTVDAAATNIPSYLKHQRSRKLTHQNWRVLWESVPITNSPIIVSKKLPPELIHQLKQTFLNSPDGIEDITGIESAGYTLVNPSDYASIEQLHKDLKLISIPAK
ncbi:phosphate/phosphite/phosphonate ABC transporter substrate-binding protein [Nostoc sp. UHCC 0702]|nr:phosphate/phosphite/phosphonate ABC transporter substrate-binding protein [Nostoc sp. UHCC 0702]